MGTSQKYSLRWNDFSLNVASTFRDLHSRQDFVDVTLACADGTTLDAHKVILSSVSSYFREILKTAPCKHPIIILKDTCREEASAMLEFAYTGEVNVGQELLPSLLHTARCFKIKGLDNVQAPAGLLEHNNANTGEHEWGSLPPTRPHTPPTRPHTPPTRPHTPSTRPHSPQSTHPHSPNSVQSSHDLKPFHEPQDVKPYQGLQPPQAPHQSDLAHPQNIKQFSDHFLASGPTPSSPILRPLSSSQPPTRCSSPASQPSRSQPPSPQGPTAPTPPQKRWKRYLARSEEEEQAPSVTSDIPADNGVAGSEFEESATKRFCEASKRYSTDSVVSQEAGKRFQVAEADSAHPNIVKRFVEPGRVLSYPHSMPASPTMMDARNLSSLGLSLRHFARVGSSEALPVNGEPREAHEHSRQGVGDRQEGAQHAIDYRFQPDHLEAHHPRGEESEVARRERLTFRPESAPTVLDMSPEGSLSGPPSQHGDSHLGHSHSGDIEHDERLNHFRNIVVGSLQPVGSSAQDLSDCVSKALAGGGGGRYSCDECGKLFKHPGSLQHHRHIHRGTHKCPSCGKAFSRRWDMERHLNKSKYGCPANRFSSTGAPLDPEDGMQGMHEERLVGLQPVTGVQVHEMAVVHNNGVAQ